MKKETKTFDEEILELLDDTLKEFAMDSMEAGEITLKEFIVDCVKTAYIEVVEQIYLQKIIENIYGTGEED